MLLDLGSGLSGSGSALPFSALFTFYFASFLSFYRSINIGCWGQEEVREEDGMAQPKGQPYLPLNGMIFITSLYAL